MEGMRDRGQKGKAGVTMDSSLTQELRRTKGINTVLRLTPVSG